MRIMTLCILLIALGLPLACSRAQETAEDAAADSRSKLAALAKRIAEGGAEVTHFALFDAKTLGSAIGRDRVVHALVQTDSADRPLSAALQRLANYRGGELLADGGDTQSVPSDVVHMD